MNTCLCNRALLLLSAGEGTSEQHAHLATCASCAAQYRRFVHDLEAIEQMLRETSPSPTVARRFFPLRLRWRPVTVAFAATLVLVWGGLWLRQPSWPPVSDEARIEDVSRFLADEVSPALFATVDVRTAPIPAPVSNSVYLQAALEGGWPCEWQEPFPTPICEIHPFPLLLGGQ
ncbi:MAG TPA: hypothetical protein VKK81_21990 [Candidatus Binatia bacterium]|nr:hypothetical protein [Candidatus Binatia bacterium]